MNNSWSMHGPSANNGSFHRHLGRLFFPFKDNSPSYKKRTKTKKKKKQLLLNIYEIFRRYYSKSSSKSIVELTFSYQDLHFMALCMFKCSSYSKYARRKDFKIDKFDKNFVF